MKPNQKLHICKTITRNFGLLRQRGYANESSSQLMQHEEFSKTRLMR